MIVDNEGRLKVDANLTSVEDNNLGICQGRLTLTSGTPITTSDVTAATTVYFTPFRGNRISLFDGTYWQTVEFSEKSVAVPATTSTPFDVFAYDNLGTPVLETLSWTNDTTRATALTLQDGIYVKSGALTRRYLGTCRTTTSSGQTEDSFANRLLWNYYNRAPVQAFKTNTSSHTYTTAAYRAWNNDTTVRFTFVLGVVEDAIYVSGIFDVTAGAAGRLAIAGLGYNSTSSAAMVGMVNSVTTRLRASTGGSLSALSVGYSYIQALEYAYGGSNTFSEAYLYGHLMR